MKVSFDETLFEKELKKGLNVLEGDEKLQLAQWCDESFPQRRFSFTLN
ncbi:hypothetical protein [Pontibacter ummariensis]|nr:hypothetical protein [Pontibacter ummariensis]